MLEPASFWRMVYACPRSRNAALPARWAALLLALVASLFAIDASAATVMWPTASQWVPLTINGAVAYDVTGDAAGKRDIVGDATTPSIYVYSDASYMYFRLRLDSDALQTPPFNYASFGWACEIDTDGVLTTYELIAGVNGIKDQVEFNQNTASATIQANNPGNKATAVIAPSPYVLSATLPYAESVSAGTTLGGTANFFLDWAIPMADWRTQVSATTPIHVLCGSSSSTQSLDTDLLAGSTPNTTVTLSGGFSDPILCDDTGCHACNTPAACGPTCAACGGATPACLPSIGCVACASSADCGGATPVCDTGSHTCRACVADAECGGSTPACEPSGACGQCSSTNATACTGATPICNATAGSCVACNGDQGTAASAACPSATAPYCVESGTSAGTCATCTSDADCTAGTNHAGPICNTSSGACGSTCFSDADCASTQFCDGANGVCTNKLANGTMLVAGDPLHGNGTCSPAVGAAECASGVCDANGDVCGYLIGDGPCSSSAACITGVCVTSGPNAGTCGACATDGDCSGATPACNAATNTCVACTSTNTAACTGATPVCNVAAGTCVACNGDAGTSASAPCPTSTDPTCFPSGPSAGTCGKCTTNGDCAQSNAGPICDVGTGACGASCTTDSDCSSTHFCNGAAGICSPKLTNGAQLIAGDPLHGNGTCDAAVGAAECASGVCDTNGNVCGLANGSGPCASSTVCISGVCVTSGPKAGTCEACGSDADCGGSTPACDATTSQCVQCTGTNTSACGGVTPVCDVGSRTCVACNGDAGTSATAACPSSAPTCFFGGANVGACGLCTSNTDCTASNAGPTCNTTTGACAAGCVADTDCAATEFCNGASGTCASKLANGDLLVAADPLHGNGTCSASVGAAECVSGVCDADDRCGLANGNGPCSAGTGSVVCRSGVCNANGVCAAPTGCTADGDCAATEFCNGTTHLCAAKLANGSALVAPDPLHGDGICAPAAALAECASGVCDPKGNVCGFALGDGPCVSTAECIAGVCVPAGPNAGTCQPCTTDATCGGAAPACNTTTNQCVACTATNATACTGTTPICDANVNACVACNGDAGSSATQRCPSDQPTCTLTGTNAGSCGKCATDADCVGHPAMTCDTSTGACGPLCTTDADCSSTSWCNNPTGGPSAGVCVAKVENGSPIPNVAPLGGTCTTAVGQRVCASGVCDTGDNRCGLPNSRGCTSATACRSGVCNADGKCGDPNGSACTTAITCRSGVCGADAKCGELAAEPCTSDVVCRADVCIGADGLCGALNGSPCTNADQASCRSGVCFGDGMCGLPDGQACTTGSACRSGACVGGTCAAACTKDGECPAGTYCNATTKSCRPSVQNGSMPDGAACDRGAECTSGVCDADGKCGSPDGAACTSALTCRSGACPGGTCGKAVAAGDPCTSDDACAARVCASDGKCGVPDGGPCADPSMCRSSICDATGTCVTSCANDGECVVGRYCSSGACLPDAPNGQKPGGVACTRGTECTSGVCDADGSCGLVNGEGCGSSLLCRSGVCDPSDAKCGLHDGAACTTADECRSGECNGGTCGPTGAGGAAGNAGSGGKAGSAGSAGSAGKAGSGGAGHAGAAGQAGAAGKAGAAGHAGAAGKAGGAGAPSAGSGGAPEATVSPGMEVEGGGCATSGSSRGSGAFSALAILAAAALVRRRRR